jgi:hypothetical protein
MKHALPLAAAMIYPVAISFVALLWQRMRRGAGR